MTPACAIFLACVLQQGNDPAYVHRLEVQPPEVKADYDGNVNESVLQALRYCAAPIEKPVVCEFHEEKEKP